MVGTFPIKRRRMSKRSMIYISQACPDSEKFLTTVNKAIIDTDFNQNMQKSKIPIPIYL